MFWGTSSIHTSSSDVFTDDDELGEEVAEQDETLALMGVDVVVCGSDWLSFSVGVEG